MPSASRTSTASEEFSISERYHASLSRRACGGGEADALERGRKRVRERAERLARVAREPALDRDGEDALRLGGPQREAQRGAGQLLAAQDIVWSPGTAITARACGPSTSATAASPASRTASRSGAATSRAIAFRSARSRSSAPSAGPRGRTRTCLRRAGGRPACGGARAASEHGDTPHPGQSARRPDFEAIDARAATLRASLVGFPSGQRGRAVNPLAQPSQVRILPPPSELADGQTRRSPATPLEAAGPGRTGAARSGHAEQALLDRDPRVRANLGGEAPPASGDEAPRIVQAEAIVGWRPARAHEVGCAVVIAHLGGWADGRLGRVPGRTHVVKPRGMPQDAQRAWDLIVPPLERLGVLDGPALEAMCLMYARASMAGRLLAEQGPLTTGSTGQLVAHPAVQIERDPSSPFCATPRTTA